MYTPTNAYQRKFSSGLIVALLAVSGLLVLVVLTSPVSASNASSPSITLSNNVVPYLLSTSETVTISNPSTNQYAITGFTLTLPTGFNFTSSGSVSTTYFTCNVATATGSAKASFSCTSTNGLPPGASNSFTSAALALKSPAPTSASAVIASATTSVQDASSAAYYSGSSQTLYGIGTTPSVIVSFASGSACNPGPFVAGSAACATIASLKTSDALGYAGVPVSWTASAHGSVTPSSTVTASSGNASATFTPTNFVKDSPTTVTATLGTSTITNHTSVVTVSGAPTKVTVTAPGSTTTTAPTDYITTFGTFTVGTTPATYADISGTSPNIINISLTDKFSNPVAFKTGDSLKLLASNGGFYNATSKAEQTSLNAAITVGATSYVATFPYIQSSVYGTVSTISAALTRSGVTYSGQSGQLITSTFDVKSNTPTTSLTGTVAAGSPLTVIFKLTNAQKGVPVELYVNSTASTAVNGNGKFSNGANATTVYTNSTGYATAAFTMDTGAGATLYFNANVTAPINGAAKNALGPSVTSLGVSTKAGAPATMIIKTYFNSALTEQTKYAVNTAGTTLYVNIALADKYGNPTTDTLGYQLQISLGAPGALSAKTVYIKENGANTSSSFGPILWTTPTTLGTAVITATSSLGSASATITVVSPTPTLTVKTVNSSPLVSGSTFYVSSSFVSINGNANVSKGYPTSVEISSVCYTLGSGVSGCASISAANTVPFSIPIQLTSGLNTVMFNATDSKGNTVNSPSYTILVDTTAPQVAFATPNNANISSPATVSAHVVDSEGDLNASSVTAVATNLQTSTTKMLTASVTGTNNPGHSVTYAVTVSGLTTGNWSVALTATDLAGNSNSSTITVHVTVPFAQSFVVSGTPHSATIGSFTGINASYTNLNPTSQSVVVFAVFKNSAGQTMGIGTGSLTVGAGATQSVFIAEPVGLASGTYSVSIFVFTTGNLPVSVSTTISVTV